MDSISAPLALPAATARDTRVAPSGSITRKHVIGVTLFLAAHLVLAVVLQSSETLSTAHAGITLLVGLVVASTTRKMSRVAIIVAYIVGCEVLWRMTRASVPWELGKYAISAIMLIALVRIRPRRNRGLPIAYFALLLPSVALTFVTLDLESARQEVSFNMSGPLAIMVSILFFSNVRLSVLQLRATYFALIGPVLAIGMISFLTTRASVAIDFENGSNLTTSGGFGPNQVSAVLGLAMLFLMLMSLERNLRWRLRAPMLGLAAILATQSALTFARGGIVLALVGTVLGAFFLLSGHPRGRLTLFAVAFIAVAVGKFVIEPKLDEMTDGKLSARYTSTKSSGRDLFISSEIDMFEENPVLGVGPGVGRYIRDQRGLFGGASHTEYTRMLAEHGMLGIFSFCCLAVLCVRAVKRATSTVGRAYALAFVGWFVLFLAVYGIRVVAPAFVLGLAFAQSVPRPRPPDRLRLFLP